MSRPRKKNVGIYLFLAIIILIAGFSYWQSGKTIIQKNVVDDYQRKSIEVAGNNIEVYIADTGEKQRLGLSIFEELPRDEGMVFEYQQPQKPGFWMKDMKFDIDIVWIRESQIVGITPDVSRLSPSVKYYPEQDIDTVLEVNGGYCKINKIEVGNRISY